MPIIYMYTLDTYVTQDRNNRFSAVDCQTDGARVRLLHCCYWLFFFSLVFYCLLLHTCLLFILMCALDMLLIKGNLLTYLLI